MTHKQLKTAARKMAADNSKISYTQALEKLSRYFFNRSYQEVRKTKFEAESAPANETEALEGLTLIPALLKHNGKTLADLSYSRLLRIVEDILGSSFYTRSPEIFEEAASSAQDGDPSADSRAIGLVRDFGDSWDAIEHSDRVFEVLDNVNAFSFEDVLQTDELTLENMQPRELRSHISLLGAESEILATARRFDREGIPETEPESYLKTYGDMGLSEPDENLVRLAVQYAISTVQRYGRNRLKASDLKVGTKVYWVDFDNGEASGFFTITSIKGEGANSICSLVNEHHAEAQAYIHELI